MTVWGLITSIFTNKPTDGLFGITYKCNSRCVMCNIWKNKGSDELTPKFFKTLPKSLKNISLTGGEPLLHSNIIEILKILTEKYTKADITMSTNGLLLNSRFIRLIQKDKKLLKNLRKIGIGISLDGPPEINDKIRGIKNDYKIVIDNIKSLKKLGFKDIRLSVTISDINVKFIRELYNLTRKLNINFTAGIVHNSDNYFNIKTNKFENLEDLKKQLNYIVTNELKTAFPKKWFMAYFIYGLYYIKKYNKRPIKCNAITHAFYIDPQGYVYPCIFLNDKIGNVNERDILAILKNPDNPEILDKVKNCQIPCWQMCTARISILKNIFKTGLWVIINKIKAHLGLTIIK